MTPAGTPADYRYVAFFIALGIAFIAITLFMSAVVRRRGRKSTEATRLSTYECGETPVGQAWNQVHIGYYVIALLFVVFDIDTIFLAPWALVLKGLHPGLVLTGFLEGVVFIAILAVGLVYAFKRGVLKWI
ncbi:MAG TPA: NADH-quinone oxidoreductase subunit A [Armatimonadota bacterium]|jgi:NADH:ubiquinone oxidoreductase subunit 3 (subunit A)